MCLIWLLFIVSYLRPLGFKRFKKRVHPQIHKGKTHIDFTKFWSISLLDVGCLKIMTF